MFKDDMKQNQKIFLNVKYMLSNLTAWKEGREELSLEAVTENCIELDKAIIMLYKSLGQAWNELTGYIISEKRTLEALKADFENFKGEINEKIDDVNNYLVSRVEDLETRVKAIEDELSSMDRVKIYIMRYENNERRIYDGSTRANALDMIELLNNDYNVFVYYATSNAPSIYNVYAFTSSEVYFVNSQMDRSKKIYFARFTFSGTTVSGYYTVNFSPEDISSDITNLNNSFTILNGRIGEAELDIVGIENTIEEAKPYQFQITLPSTASSWRSYGNRFFYNAPETFDLTKPALVTLTAGGILTDYDEVLDNLERARAIGLFGCFDDDGGEPAQSCLQFYVDTIPDAPVNVLVTISPYLSTSTAGSTVANCIY